MCNREREREGDTERENMWAWSQVSPLVRNTPHSEKGSCSYVFKHAVNFWSHPLLVSTSLNGIHVGIFSMCTIFKHYYELTEVEGMGRGRECSPITFRCVPVYLVCKWTWGFLPPLWGLMDACLLTVHSTLNLLPRGVHRSNGICLTMSVYTIAAIQVWVCLFFKVQIYTA